jgi:uncharacterized protein (DUF433 family)
MTMAVETNRTLYQDRIIQDPNIMVGKPVIKGTRIPVERVLAHLASTPDLAGLFAAYPRLTRADVQAALAYVREAVESQGRKARRTPKPPTPASA